MTEETEEKARACESALNELLCDYCQQPASLVSGKEIYPHRKDLYSKKFWQCKPCGAYVGTHKNSPEHKPLGRLADAELRKAKQAAHRAFDPMWRQGKMTRRKAYNWLANALGIRVDLCHIGMFDIFMCKQVVAVCSGT